jgi:hypothetical protein
MNRDQILDENLFEKLKYFLRFPLNTASSAQVFPKQAHERYCFLQHSKKAKWPNYL